MNLDFRYTDVTPDGLRVWCNSPESYGPENPEPPVVVFGDDAPITLPAYGLQLRVSPLGDRCVVKGHSGPIKDLAVVVNRSGVTETLGLIYGDTAAGFAPDGRLVYVSSATHYFVEGEGPRAIPQGLQGTSQGFLDVADDATPLWTDTNRFGSVNGRTLVKPHSSDEWMVGQAGDGTDRLFLWGGGDVLAYTVYTPFGPRVSNNGTVAVSLPGRFLTPEDFIPLASASPEQPGEPGKPESPSPLPTPIPSPGGPVPDMPDPPSFLHLVEAEWAAGRPDGTYASGQAFCRRLARRIIAETGDQTYGVNGKRGNPDDQSSDIIAKRFGSDPRHCRIADVIRAATGPWGDHGEYPEPRWDIPGAHPEPAWGWISVEEAGDVLWLAVQAEAPTPTPVPVPTPPTPLPPADREEAILQAILRLESRFNKVYR